jgi:hypothetical protein
MRRLTSTAVIVAAVATLLGTSPVPAAPRASVTYRGTGQGMFNNAPNWVKAPGKGKSISFKVSKDGTRVLNFRGRYAYYCGAGASTITAASLKVRHGRFGGNGKKVNQSGTNYFALSGRFSADGRTATVTYLDDFVYKGKSVKNPYSFTYHAPARACESRVTGAVTAR